VTKWTLSQVQQLGLQLIQHNLAIISSAVLDAALNNTGSFTRSSQIGDPALGLGEDFGNEGCSFLFGDVMSAKFFPECCDFLDEGVVFVLESFLLDDLFLLFLPVCCQRRNGRGGRGRSGRGDRRRERENMMD